jgi:hypothetical protein
VGLRGTRPFSARRERRTTGQSSGSRFSGKTGPRGAPTVYPSRIIAGAGAALPEICHPKVCASGARSAVCRTKDPFLPGAAASEIGGPMAFRPPTPAGSAGGSPRQ